jgi:hypothetical protein
VYTNIQFGDRKSLTGMDLVTLALARAGNARDALKVIVALNEKYGQVYAASP